MMPKSTSAPSNVRLLAWNGLCRWGRGGIFAETLVARDAAAHSLSSSDRALLQALLFDTLRHMAWLDYLRRELRPAALEEKLRWLVLMGLCQLFILKQAEHAAVSETVRLAPARARGLVNAMLRNAIRRREEFESAWGTLPPGIRFSTPSWLVRRWMAEFGEQETLSMLEWNTGTPPVYARTNPLNPPLSIPEEWEAMPRIPGWFRVHGALPLQELRNGQLYIADPSTRYCVQLLAPRPGERILDACAAPGGKSAAMLAAAGGQLELVATDAVPHRLEALRQNLERAGARNPLVRLHDWQQPCPQEWVAHFDAVLLDVPCSNSGVLQRRVDARWRLSPEEIARLATLQRQILEQACQAVRPGGRLVYSTCSIDREEDRDVVDAFLASHPEFELVEDYLALPHREQADGAYAALLRRQAM